jgi:hypothetical protein
MAMTDAQKQLKAYQSQITEAHVQRDCLDLLLSLQFLVIRVNQGSVTQEATETQARRHVKFATWQAPGFLPQSAGISDILAIEPGCGRLWAIEVKRPGKIKNTTEPQEYFLQAATEAGAVAIVVDNVELLRAEIAKERGI